MVTMRATQQTKVRAGVELQSEVIVVLARGREVQVLAERLDRRGNLRAQIATLKGPYDNPRALAQPQVQGWVTKRGHDGQVLFDEMAPPHIRSEWAGASASDNEAQLALLVPGQRRDNVSRRCRLQLLYNPADGPTTMQQWDQHLSGRGGDGGGGVARPAELEGDTYWLSSSASMFALN
jgi:hypothetical protein